MLFRVSLLQRLLTMETNAIYLTEGLYKKLTMVYTKTVHIKRLYKKHLKWGFI